MWLLVSSSEICWFSTASGGSALGRLLMFSSGVTSSSEVAPGGGALHGDFSGGLVDLDTTTKLSSSELLSLSTGSCITWDLKRGGN